MHCYYFNLNGSIISMSQENATALMERIAPEWKRTKTQWGTLYLAQYDWYGEVVEGEYKTFPPKLKDGTTVRHNLIAQQFFSEKILGECFLCPSEHKREEVLAFIGRHNISFDAA